ncbi:MAG TPA: hypothetical protein VF628_14340 [Allosphingosinicella sp.]|jgi:hypothetical protein
MNALCATEQQDVCEDASDRANFASTETELAFFKRRAFEEARSAQRATCPRAAAAHRYLAEAYAEQVRREIEAEERFDALLAALA